MLYFKASQPVPGKGDAWVFYECDEAFAIKRQMTHIPATGETDCITKPIVKKMTNMAYMTQSSQEEFDQYWSDDHVKETPETTQTYDSDGPVFHLDMTIGEAMAVHPRVAEVFAAFQLGGCSHCGISQYETVGQVCMAYGVDHEMLLEVLEDLLKPSEAEATS